MSGGSGKKYRLGFLNSLDGAFEQLFNDGVGDRGTLTQRALESIRRAQELNVFRGMTEYNAIVVSTPVLTGVGAGADANNKYIFRARIPELHAEIGDPFCYDPGVDHFHKLAGRHPQFKADQSASESFEGIGIGDIVLVGFSKGPSSSRTISGKFIKRSGIAKLRAYETECDNLIQPTDLDFCGTCVGDPDACLPASAGSTVEAYEGAPVQLSEGFSNTPYNSGNTDGKSGPCSALWYEDNHGLGANQPQVSPCCCGQMFKFGITDDDGGNHQCATDYRGCHSMVTPSSSRSTGGANYSNADAHGGGSGNLNCSTGAYIRYATNTSSLNELTRPLWEEFVSEVQRIAGGGIRFSYSSVRRSVKHQWILFTGRQGLGSRAGIFFPSQPLGGSGGGNISGHRLGAACDGRWVASGLSRVGGEWQGVTTGMNSGWNGLDYLGLCAKINSEIAGGGTGTDRSTAYSRTATKYGIGWFGAGDDVHWEMFYCFIDQGTGEVTNKSGGGQMTRLSGLPQISNLGAAATAYYYGLHGELCCRWHEDLVDLPLEFLTEECPNADLACLARLGDPSTYQPSILTSGIISDAQTDYAILGGGDTVDLDPLGTGLGDSIALAQLDAVGSAANFLDEDIFADPFAGEDDFVIR